MALADTSDGTPASTENSGSIASFVRILSDLGKSEDQAPVAHNETSAEPSAPKTNIRPPSRNIPRWQRRKPIRPNSERSQRISLTLPPTADEAIE
jgi:hypothetical protein